MLEVTTRHTLLDENEEGSQWLLDQSLIFEWTELTEPLLSLQNASQLNTGLVGIPNLSG